MALAIKCIDNLPPRPSCFYTTGHYTKIGNTALTSLQKPTVI